MSYKNWKQTKTSVRNSVNVKKAVRKLICKKAFMLLLWVKKQVLQKNADIVKTTRVFVLKGIFSETSYVFVLIYQISRF